MEINKILVANRGEIALRIMRSAREMGIKTVAIYSEADRFSPHVKYAEEAVCVGAAPSAQSYLQMDKIIEISKRLQVDAIHPGYGFLSERAIFAEKVTKAGLIFIGPSAESIEIMGSKIGAKNAAHKFGIPLVPGLKEAITDIPDAKRKALEIGYPILIKASAGGGGKGMRVVENEAEFDEQMQRAISEATAAFGDGSVFIEKFVTSPKHIEIQILGDQHGNIIYLFERECSIQRRHQKLIEEAPSSCLTPEIRKAMGECAVLAAKACNYYSAGTVEFVVDDALNFYFLEMNTRLQVEHPVTEMVTGIDLVKQQILIAEGKPLEIKQEDLKIHGHAIEVRVCAEDPANHFLPEVGILHKYHPPRGVGIRVDDGFEEGMEIPIYYDNMIAKLITYAGTRKEAISRMERAIDDFQITGIQTTLSFCRYVLGHESFLSGKFNTKFVENYFRPENLASIPQADEEKIAAALVSNLLENGSKTIIGEDSSQTSTVHQSNWKNRKYATKGY